MGGRGSGNYQRIGAQRSTLEAPALDVRELARKAIVRMRKFAHPEMGGADWLTLCWRFVGGRVWRILVGLSLQRREMSLEFWLDGRRHAARIELEQTACTFGGVRWWARCPVCARRCAVLWWSTAWACRICHRLAYPTAQNSKVLRIRQRAEHIHARLGGYGFDGLFSAPARPRRMHCRTYDRLVAELERRDRRDFERVLRAGS